MRRTILLILLFIALLPAILFSQVLRTLSYQGVLTDSLGNPKPDNSYNLTFRLYGLMGGGTVLWSETKSLQVKRGLFSTILGDQTPLPDSLIFDRPYWLSLQVASEPELSPRIPLTAVGYSLYSIKADTAKFAITAPLQAYVDSARIASVVPNNSITSQNVLDGTIQRVDVVPTFTVPYADTATYAKSAPVPAFIDSARTAGTVADNSVTSVKIANGTIKREDLETGLVAPKADTAVYALSAPQASFVDSARIASTVTDNSITGAKIVNGTIQRVDVTSNFTAPYSDTAQYARSAPQQVFVDSARIASTIPDNSVTSSKIVNGTIQFTDIAQNGAANGQVMKWNGSSWTAGNDSVGVVGSSQWTTSGSNIYYNSGNVGIGTAAPVQKLDVQGSINIMADSSYRVNNERVLSNKGNANIFIGADAGRSNTGGSYNTATGYRSLYSNSAGAFNTATGYEALYTNSTGMSNTATGYGALNTNSTGSFNTAIGLYALYLNSTGDNNAASGYRALYSNSTGNSNVAVGFRSLYNNTDRSNLVAIGDSALFNNGIGAASYQAVGNTAVGSKAMSSNTTGFNNTATGFQSLYTNSTGLNTL